MQQHALLVALVALMNINTFGLVHNPELLPQSFFVLLNIKLVLLFFKHRLLAFQELLGLLSDEHWALSILAALLIDFLLAKDVLLYIVK